MTRECVAQLEFDRGTLVLRDPPPGLDAASLPAMRWDPRVAAFRAPGCALAAIRERLRVLGVRVADRVCPPWRRLTLARPALRPYQGAALAAWRANGARGVVVLPTGAGKTHVALAAIAAVGGPALCLVPTRVLLAQWASRIEEQWNLEVGVLGDGTRTVRDITVATFASARIHMPRLGNRFALLVADEAHHLGGGTGHEVLELCCAPWRLGLTATPPGPDAERVLADCLGDRVFELGIDDLRGGFLADFERVVLTLELTAGERRDYEAAWDVFRAEQDRFRGLAPVTRFDDFVRWAARTPRGRQAVGAWHRARQLAAWTRAKSEVVGQLLATHVDDRVLVFVASKDAAHAVAREHLVMPITADIGRRERDEALRAFRSGKLRALVSAQVLNEGLDVPDARVGIITAGAGGPREHVQRVGRLLRPAPEKRALVYELVSRHTYEVGLTRRRRQALGP